MRIVPIAIASVALLAGAGVAAKVSGPQAAQVMHLRHEGMENIGKNFKVLNRELNVSSPDVGTVRSSAASITKLAFQSGAWFPEGTGPEVGKTGAKPDIWLSQNRADFAAKLHNFQIAAPRFNAGV